MVLEETCVEALYPMIYIQCELQTSVNKELEQKPFFVINQVTHSTNPRQKLISFIYPALVPVPHDLYQTMLSILLNGCFSWTAVCGFQKTSCTPPTKKTLLCNWKGNRPIFWQPMMHTLYKGLSKRHHNEQIQALRVTPLCFLQGAQTTWISVTCFKQTQQVWTVTFKTTKNISSRLWRTPSDTSIW